MFVNYSVKKSSIKYIILVVAFMLIFSFLAHDMIPHHHPSNIYGSGIQAVFHGNDRKWLYLALLLAIFIALNFVNKWKLDIRTQKIFSIYFLRLRNYIQKIFNPISQALRTGILNPKLCD